MLCSRIWLNSIVRQFQSQLYKSVKLSARNEFCRDHLEGRFRNCVIVGTAFHAQGTTDLKAFQEFIYQFIVKLTVTICMKDLDFKQVSFHGRKGIMNQIGDFVSPCAISDDLSSTQIQQHRLSKNPCNQKPPAKKRRPKKRVYGLKTAIRRNEKAMCATAYLKLKQNPHVLRGDNCSSQQTTKDLYHIEQFQNKENCSDNNDKMNPIAVNCGEAGKYPSTKSTEQPENEKYDDNCP